VKYPIYGRRTKNETRLWEKSILRPTGCTPAESGYAVPADRSGSNRRANDPSGVAGFENYPLSAGKSSGKMGNRQGPARPGARSRVCGDVRKGLYKKAETR